MNQSIRMMIIHSITEWSVKRQVYYQNQLQWTMKCVGGWMMCWAGPTLIVVGMIKNKFPLLNHISLSTNSKSHSHYRTEVSQLSDPSNFFASWKVWQREMLTYINKYKRIKWKWEVEREKYFDFCINKRIRSNINKNKWEWKWNGEIDLVENWELNWWKETNL